MSPSCDHTGVPGEEAFAHFHSSTISGSASWISSRIRFWTEPRQSPSSRMRSSILWEAESDVVDSASRGTGHQLLEGGLVADRVEVRVLGGEGPQPVLPPDGQPQMLDRIVRSPSQALAAGEVVQRRGVLGVILDGLAAQPDRLV